MAEDSDDLELEVKEKSSGGNKNNLILIIIIIVLVAIIAVGATLLFVGGGSSKRVVVEGEEGEVIEAVEQKRAAVYHDIRPPFVVNFHTKGRIRYVQIHVELMARSDDVIDAVKLNMPLIKNNLVTLFSSADFKEIQTYEGKEKLRESALEEVQRILLQETGEPGVEAVLFTSFVIQ